MDRYTLIVYCNYNETIITYTSFAKLLNKISLLMNPLLENIEPNISFKTLLYKNLNFDYDSTQIQLGKYMLTFFRPILIDKVNEYILETSYQRWKACNNL